ncbi:hypothetical protein L228DRAFT_276229 [Xylona heveae TC161]|uniref:Uncharacterized protein n=1 Tax=Xylona heveae (strain CBS 132557 / TC161) TaxID=1328760 RepID=A0A165HEA7_XYLHT|nr:hypothetical protein L228DRAFT_276229 [Xylona heveae TC161]KZF23380.1 hypothetical protein L228DRAFT_276229 [Xylona heveae TC161]
MSYSKINKKGCGMSRLFRQTPPADQDEDERLLADDLEMLPTWEELNIQRLQTNRPTLVPARRNAASAIAQRPQSAEVRQASDVGRWTNVSSSSAAAEEEYFLEELDEIDLLPTYEEACFSKKGEKKVNVTEVQSQRLGEHEEGPAKSTTSFPMASRRSNNGMGNVGSLDGQIDRYRSTEPPRSGSTERPAPTSASRPNGAGGRGTPESLSGNRGPLTDPYMDELSLEAYLDPGRHPKDLQNLEAHFRWLKRELENFLEKK